MIEGLRLLSLLLCNQKFKRDEGFLVGVRPLCKSGDIKHIQRIVARETVREISINRTL